MRITFTLTAKMEHSLLFHNVNDNLAILNKFARFFSNEQINPISILSDYAIKENRIIISLHPAEDPLIFECMEDKVCVSVTTGISGPGYHAYIVEMFDMLEKKYKLAWSEYDGKSDISGYFKNRDFDALKEYFLDSLMYTSNTLIKRSSEGFSKFMIDVPEDYPMVDKEYFAATPLGYFGKIWFSDFASTEDDGKKYEMAKEFYIWYDRDIDANFWFKTALSMIWLFFPFRIALNDTEKKLYSGILYAFEMAYKKDSSLSYPYDIWISIAEYLGDDAIAKIIKKRTADAIIVSSDIGLRRENGISEIAGGFYISMPMRMRLIRNENEGTVEISDNKIKALFQVYSFKSENKNIVMKRVIEHIDKSGDKGEEIPFRHKEYISKAYERKFSGDSYLITSVIALDKLALIAWYTYKDDKDKSVVLDSLSKISYIE